jgi:hypothetical protein
MHGPRARMLSCQYLSSSNRNPIPIFDCYFGGESLSQLHELSRTIAEFIGYAPFIEKDPIFEF